MPKLTKILSKHNSFFLAICCSVFILILSLVNKVPQPGNFEINDKVGHTFAYFTMSFFWFIFTKHLAAKFSKLLLVGFVCIVYGIVIEIMQQTLTSTRTASFLDVLANTIGVCLSLSTIIAMKIKVKK